MILALGISLTACASTDVATYRDSPSARIHCAKFLDKSAEAEVSGAITTNRDQAMGGASAKSTIKGLRDNKGSIYSACLEDWAIQQANRPRRCAIAMFFGGFFLFGITWLLIPFCFV